MDFYLLVIRFLTDLVEKAKFWREQYQCQWRILQKIKSGIDRTKEMAYYRQQEMGFHRTSCYGLLVSFFYCKNVIQIFPAIFSVVDQQPGMENVVSDEYIFFIDREGKTDIIPIPAVFGIFIVFFLAVFFKSWVRCYLDQLRYRSGGICLRFCICTHKAFSAF